MFVFSEGLQFLNYDKIFVLDFNCIILFIVVVIIFGNEWLYDAILLYSDDFLLYFLSS